MIAMTARRSIQKRHTRSRNPPHVVNNRLSSEKELVMKLYGFPPSPNTWQVRALASYLGVPLDFEFVDLTKGASHTPAFLAINPTGRTPALVDGDFKLWETLAIMQYIAGKKPSALWPNDARTRADITRWQSWNLVHWN